MRGTLRKRSQFQEVYERGGKAVGRLCVVYSYRADAPATPDHESLAVGVVASRKVGNAVARSRAKRRLREAYRGLRSRIDGPRWIVLVARQALAARNLPHERIHHELESLLQELGALLPSEPSVRGDAPS